MRRFLRPFILCAPVIFLVWSPAMLHAIPAAGDSLYNANHPRLLFHPTGIAALQNKVADGGYDGDAYDFIRLLANLVFPSWPQQTLLYSSWSRSDAPHR